jgi:tRNA/tmRNA/rRNA uracil-C5-methylase (TrmA/RlmC/RlmD family)
MNKKEIENIVKTTIENLDLNNDNIRCLDLFSGYGGISLGF